MAIKRSSFDRFADKFKQSMLNVDDSLVRGWTLLTVDTLVKAQNKAPVASGALEGSGDFLKAELTPSGITSAVLFKVPYARQLNDENSGIILKNKGELSYYANGTKVNKQRKGVLGFLNKAKKENAMDFINITKGIVSKQFIGI